MDPRAWTQGGRDRGRAARLSVGLGGGVVMMAAMLTFMKLAGAGGGASPLQSEPEVVHVELAKTPEEEPPEEAEAPEEPGPRAAGPVMPRLVVPQEIPKEQVKETDVKPAESGEGQGDPYANAGGGGQGKGTAAPKPAPAPEPKPAPAPKAVSQTPEKKKVFRGGEVAVEPTPHSRPHPAYPAAARSAGIEGVVVVRYVITEAGATAAVKAVRGPAELLAACEAAVRSWTFTPARDAAGQAVPVVKFARFPFKIKT